jgi:hypothetical protein
MGSEGDKVRTLRELIEEVEALHRQTDELIGHIAAQLDTNSKTPALLVEDPSTRKSSSQSKYKK